jgi:hypothetical protein
MMVTIVLVAVWLRPREMKRLWPAIIPLALVVHLAAPGTIGAIQDMFFPSGGLISEQKNTRVGSGRLATLGPVLRTEWEPHAIFGEGFATRITTKTDLVPVPNAPITDDQWLSTLAETGAFGALMLAWMFLRFIRRAGREAKRDPGPRGWLIAACVASVAAYAVGMFTYDAFSFIQVTFLLFIILGLGCAAWRTVPEVVYQTAPARRTLLPRGAIRAPAAP